MQHDIKMAIDEKCKKTDLQNVCAFVYNLFIAVTPAWLLILRSRHATVITNKKEDCSER